LPRNRSAMTKTEQGIEKNGELREEEGTVKDEGTK
jgi:hypothetical protein